MDIVKVLKTQDENYIRTMRTAGLKVCMNYYQKIVIFHIALPQKIDKIKSQLTALADLVKPRHFNTDNDDDSAVEDDLDEDELQILRDAGVIYFSRSKGSGNKSKHIVFVDDEQEGAHILCYL